MPGDFERTLALESAGAGFQLFFFCVPFGYLLNHSGINSYIYKMGLSSYFMWGLGGMKGHEN